MAEGLQARGWVQITQGGYTNEEKGANGDLSTAFSDVPESGTATVSYYYRDSNFGEGQLPDLNKSSSRVDVKLKTEWTATKQSGNTYVVKTKTTILSIERCCKDESAGKISQNPTRTINVSGKNGTVLSNLISSPANTGTIWSGSKVVGENTYTIPPGQEVSVNELSAIYLNYTTGYWSPGNPLPSTYVDEMRMGVQFKNNLPDRCDPPVLMSVTQTDDICENEVTACLRFAPCTCDGMALVIQYHFDGETWADAIGNGQEAQINASDSAANVICFDHLPPTNHTREPVIFYWRAKYIPITSTMPETEWVEGSFEIMFILHPHETVPDISAQECAMLERGELIGKYEEETCYNEFSCADDDYGLR